MTIAAVKKPFPPGMPIGPGHVIAGKYRVDELVAIGGMGIVVAAQHLQLGQTVAIKVLLPSELFDEGAAIPRFLREARAAAGIHSEHVVRIYDVDTLPDGLPYMVMELLEGVDLRRIVKTHGPLPVEQAVDFVLQAADALEEAHRLGIVHRDIKPSNLFLSRRKDGRALVKILDFGISKASHDQIDGTLTTSRAMIGSPMYMSPEQVRDSKSVDGRSDIWSLGVILYELLVGKPAFRGDSLPAICAAIAADQPPPLRVLRPDVPVELEKVILTCLAKNPDERYPTVDVFAQALADFLPHEMQFMPTVPAPSGSAAPFEFPAPHIPPSMRPSASNVSVKTKTGPLSAPAAVIEAAQSSAPSRPSTSDSGENLPTVRYDSHFPSSATASKQAASVIQAGNSELPLARSATTAPAIGRPRLGLFVLAGALFLALAAGLSVLVIGKRPVAPAPAASVAPPKSFTLRVESTPSGAEVSEKERVLGKTPVDLVIERESVANAPRELLLRLDGFKPATVKQGLSDTDLRVQAELQPQLAAAEPTPSAAPPRSPPVVPRQPHSAAPKPSARQTPPPSTDIKLHR